MLFNRLWIILVLIVILIISVVYRESFVSNERVLEERILEERVKPVEIQHDINYPGKYQVLDDSLDYLNSYSSDLKEHANKIKNISNGYFKNRKSNQVISNSKPIPTNAFETLNYNKALLSAIQLQNFEDRYLYKFNEKLNY